MASVLFDKNNGVGTITLNRPDKFNSFDTEMGKLFLEALNSFENDSEVRCIQIIGSGKAFCAGQDLAEAIDPNGPSLEEIIEGRYNPIILKITSIEKPIVAAVNGVAAGAGANIALACDIVVATESASFIQAFSKIGLVPDSGGTYLLSRLIGFQKAMALCMLGDKVSAEEAEKMGMIYRFFPDENFAESVEKLSNKLAKMPTLGLGLTKRAMHLGLKNSLEEQLKVECHLQDEAAKSHDYQEGVNSFLEKRKPVFKGH